MDRPPRILVVDDKYYIRQLLVTALGLKGYEVLAAHDGRDGLELAARNRPDLILLDLVMPGVDGLQMLRALRSMPETASIPVVLMSARGDLDPGAPPAGATGCLFKPFDLDRLEALVRRYLRAAAPVPGTPAGEEVAAAGEASTGEAGAGHGPGGVPGRP